MSDPPQGIKKQPTVRFSQELDRNEIANQTRSVLAGAGSRDRPPASRWARRGIFTRQLTDYADTDIPLKEQPSQRERRISHSASATEEIVPDVRNISSAASILSDKEHKRERKGKRNSASLKTNAALPFYSQYASKYSRSPALARVKQSTRRFYHWVLQIKHYHADPLGRNLLLDTRSNEPLLERQTQKPYINNAITSSRYTLYNFLPRQLAFQFSKIANCYFLGVSIMQMIPGLSTTGTYTTIIPLAFFIILSMAREGYDDFRRHRMDQAENNKSVQVYRAGQADPWTTIKWWQIRVGDVVRLKKNDWIPADLVLLHSQGQNGVAYIETAALDGETNLKSKRAITKIAEQTATLDLLAGFQATLHSESPNQDLYNYEGTIEMGEEKFPITSEQIIYRGSIMRNTSEAWAAVVFTGEETKIRMNASKNVRTKKPSIQAVVNKIVAMIVLFVIGLAVFCTVGYYIWHNKTEKHLWYLASARQLTFVQIFVSFIILYNTMVPLSLYVSLEIVKLIQQILLQADIDMYHEQSDTPAVARTSTINEELGQVSYVFTDKTGTLTDNEMVFRKISVAGHAWLHDLDLQRSRAQERPFLLHKLRKGKKATKRDQHLGSFSQRSNSIHVAEAAASQHVPRRSLGNAMGRRSTSSWHRPSTAAPTGLASSPLRSTHDMLDYIRTHPHTVFARRARLFLLSIALCHTALPEYEQDETIPKFSAASPDELALVNAAMEMGYMVVDRSAQKITLHTHPAGLDDQPVEEVYIVHDIIEFSSARKRMSCIVEMPDGRYCLFCKGADSFLMERMRMRELAKRKWLEVEKQAQDRQSMEAERARKSLARPSVALSRPSVSGNRLEVIRDLDAFLDRARESVTLDEGGIAGPSGSYGGRSSFHLARHSMAYGEPKSPLQRSGEDTIDDLLVRNESAVFEQTFKHLHDFAGEGLRVLLYGHRFMTADEYRSWKKVYAEAQTSFENRQGKMEQAAELIEVDLDLTGATAIEDKLQDGVPQTIDKLRRAGIKIWMLTGDKRETAINIGHSCGLIKDYSTTIILDKDDPEMAGIMATRVLEIIDETIVHSVVVVDGSTLAFIEEDLSLRTLFLDLGVKANSVICCRASPAQKALLVRHVRKEVKASITLAIGDGANDIAMIREAHVGIGIAGKEGLQAARTSDYSIAQFRFLLKLLLCHGRWNYIRISKYILCTFYKEMLLFMTQAIYQRFVGYTGTSLHESWSLTLFNTLFTSLAVIGIGAFERDLSSATLLAVPELYATSRLGRAFGMKKFVGWMVLVASQAVIVYYLAYYAYAYWVTPDLYPFGNMVFTACVAIINVKCLFLEMHVWSILNYAFFFISYGGWWVWTLAQSLIFSHQAIYFVKDAIRLHFGRQLSWWAGLFLVTAIPLLIDVALQALRSAFMPTEEDIFRELQQDAAGKARLEEEAAMELQNGWIEGILNNRNKSVQDQEQEDDDGGDEEMAVGVHADKRVSTSTREVGATMRG
jgi:phospholipid-translocating ATPase